jgi:hypothetical protein
MSEHVKETIALVQQEIESLNQQVAEKKRMVNGLCALVKQPPIYTDADLLPSTGMGPIQPDEYYGQPLSTAMRMILDRRKLAKLGPATVNDIYDALIAGGYKFTTSVEEHAKRGLYSTLTKSTQVFHKLPNGSYGLLEWYPNAKEAKVAAKSANKATGATTNGTDATFKTDDSASETDDSDMTSEAVAATAPAKAK